jgi:hypothetical protein
MIKRLLGLLVILILFTGCGPSALQIQAEIAYYEALATMQKNQAATPVFMMVATDQTKPIILENVAKIEVYGQPSESMKTIPQYQHRDYFEPFWRVIGTVATVAAPVVASGVVLHGIKGLVGGGSTYYTNNVGQNASGNFRVQGNTTATSSGGGAATATGMNDATSVPTVVEQPSPIIVEQPAPIIVEQPAPIVVTP